MLVNPFHTTSYSMDYKDEYDILQGFIFPLAAFLILLAAMILALYRLMFCFKGRFRNTDAQLEEDTLLSKSTTSN